MEGVAEVGEGDGVAMVENRAGRERERRVRG